MQSEFKITKWNAAAIIAKIEAEEIKRLTRAAIHLQNEIKKTLSMKGNKCGKEEHKRSWPEQPPRLECGELHRSITYEIDKENKVARVGTKKKYVKFLELGTRNMRMRPFLRPTLAENIGRIRKIMTN